MCRNELTCGVPPLPPAGPSPCLRALGQKALRVACICLLTAHTRPAGRRQSALQGEGAPGQPLSLSPRAVPAPAAASQGSWAESRLCAALALPLVPETFP